jgi:tuftelin-interacting protein 11
MEVAADADHYRTGRERVRPASDYEGRSYKRRRAESHARFVSIGHVMPSENAAAVAGHAEEHLPTALGRRIADGARARREERERSRRVQDTPPPEPGSLASNAVVARMMAIHGYKPGTGLGKNAQGIVAPLEATRLPNKAGLGSVQVVKLFSGKENSPPPSAEKEEPMWSKKASANRKKELPSVRGAEQACKVIDMRGPHARVLRDLTGLNQQQEMELDDDVPMPELQYNVRLLADEGQVFFLR